ncbi:hypothetical protein B0H17DRAFT_1051450 [Mycena rosella]|uniref:Uncharacterized protein n=1 Tax=Mycena rosella TaxID=1033263 RepID=A0AAD7DSB3_MYCRO|nr:hypothetical protein B0H17DRAFT_1051450 [Mycena rosella]
MNSAQVIMHFIRAILSFATLAVTAVQAAPGVSTSLTKRWCGFEHSCPCDFNRKEGCVPQFDHCGKQWYWPPQCTGCAPCLELCVDFICDPPAS